MAEAAAIDADTKAELRALDAAPEAKAAVEAVKGKIIKEVAEDAPPAPDAPPPLDERAERQKSRTSKLAELDRLAQEQIATRQRQVQDKAKSEDDAKRAVERDKKLAELEAKVAEIDQDPLSYLEKRGTKPSDLARRVIQEGKPDPVRDAKAAVQQELERIKAENEKVLQAERDRLEQEKQRVVYEQAVSDLTRQFVSGSAKYPSLHEFFDDPKEVVSEIQNWLVVLRQNPEVEPYLDQYSNAELLEGLEARYSRKLSKFKTPKVETPSVRPPETPPAKTITNARASRQPVTRPKDFETWPERKQNEWLLRQHPIIREVK